MVKINNSTHLRELIREMLADAVDRLTDGTSSSEEAEKSAYRWVFSHVLSLAIGKTNDFEYAEDLLARCKWSVRDPNGRTFGNQCPDHGKPFRSDIFSIDPDTLMTTKFYCEDCVTP